jgi:hypothetical protein
MNIPHWLQQAALAAEGKWDALKQLQAAENLKAN